MGRVSDAKQRLMDAVGELIWTGSYGATTIDQICERAEVKKGSFYYFFDSKADLAAAAIDSDWTKRRVELDAIFSPTEPPLQRLRPVSCPVPFPLLPGPCSENHQPSSWYKRARTPSITPTIAGNQAATLVSTRPEAPRSSMSSVAT